MVAKTKIEETVSEAILNVDTQLQVKDRTMVVHAVEHAYRLQKEITRASVAIGDELMKIAKRAVDLAGNNLPRAVDHFKNLCTYGENYILNVDKEERSKDPNDEFGPGLRPIGKVIPSWSTFKSGILKSLTVGVDPNERHPEGNAPKYATHNQYIAAGRETPGAQVQRGAQSVSKLALHTANAMIEPLRAAYALLGQNAAALTDKAQEELVPLMEQWNNTVAGMQKRVSGDKPETPKTEAHGAPLEAPQTKAEAKEARKRGGSK